MGSMLTMFDRLLSRKLTVGNSLRLQETESTDMFRISRILLFIYLVIGGFIAWDNGYLNLPAFAPWPAPSSRSSSGSWCR